MNLFYFLNPDKSYHPCAASEWEGQFHKIDRQVKCGEVNGCSISTVWLGINNNFYEGEPLLFETMIFDIEGRNIYMTRYATWDKAIDGHVEAIQWVLDGCQR